MDHRDSSLSPGPTVAQGLPILPSGDTIESVIRVDYCKLEPGSAVRSLLHAVPIPLSVREAIRMRAIAEVPPLRTPILDVGCGDGLFWEIVTRCDGTNGPRSLDGLVGIDISHRDVLAANERLRGTGSKFRVVDITDPIGIARLAENQEKFRTVIANCSLEHVRDLDRAVTLIRSLLATPGGEIVLFVPTPDWTKTLWTKRAISRFSDRLAGAYGGLFDGFFMHHHLYSHTVWRSYLADRGFQDIEISGLGSQTANWLVEAWLPPSVVSYAMKFVLRRYPFPINWLQAQFVERMTDFVTQIQEGSTMTDDLGRPDVIEYFIRART